ncbi:MAG TPA: hypothetical protein VE988_22780 [Gemmataceae bacterium]|nr:hypothetical protein [Gemmataceae bacterium]
MNDNEEGSVRLGSGCGLPSAMLDIVRCPKCRGPLVARVGRGGPYYHCLCIGDAEPVAIVEATKVLNPARQAG